ncbi:MazG-like pyrophosphatase [Pseudomonas phage vB_PpuM-Roomu-2]|uniref:MazG-like pyrophosphatase n=1 Tax=Pseudomonas phage vB_PpuM-Roomu-2 TaxID=3132621 RepID=A0AAX4N045_9CAUD
MSYIPEIGERVELIEDYGNRLKGEAGVATRINSRSNSGEVLVGVKMDAQRYGSRSLTCFAKRLKPETPKQPAGEGILEQVRRVSALFGKRRPLTPVMLQLQEELGELSTEVAIATGTKRRTPSEDGVAGEAVDVAIVALDIAMLETGGDIEAIKAIFERKLAKWESYK